MRKATLGNIREIKQLDTPVFGNQTVGISGDSAAAKRVPASAPEKSRVIRRRLRGKEGAAAKKLGRKRKKSWQQQGGRAEQQKRGRRPHVTSKQGGDGLVPPQSPIKWMF